MFEISRIISFYKTSAYDICKLNKTLYKLS